MRQKKWKQVLAVLLCALVFAGCTQPDTGVFLTEFDRRITKVFLPVSEVEKEAFLLTGNSGLFCLPDESMTRESSADPYVLLYRVNDPLVLMEADAAKRVYPASVTKLLTAYTALKNADLRDVVTISYRASHVTVAGATLCGFFEGDTLSLRDLLSAMLLVSGNDAAIAVAEHVSGSVEEFVALMNQEMKKLGGMHSNFVNSHGLHDEKHYTTAYDMYLVLHAFYQEKEFLELLQQSSCTISVKNASGIQDTKTFQSTNLFLSKDREVPDGIRILGGKTGTTNAAGCCLAQIFVTEKGNAYIAEVFGAEDYTQLYDKMTELMLFALEKESTGE